jgi:hypothetical protein
VNVTKVTATVRYSQDTGKGAWKSLEIGVEASINEREDWQKTQAHLYSDLAKQFKALWSANGVTTHQEGHQTDAQPSSALSSPDDSSQRTDTHYCQDHGVPFKARNGQYGEFYSHQIKGTRQWCNEAKK